MTEIVKIKIENIPKFLLIQCFGEIAHNSQISESLSQKKTPFKININISILKEVLRF